MNRIHQHWKETMLESGRILSETLTESATSFFR